MSSPIDLGAKPEPTRGRIRIAPDAVFVPEEEAGHFREIAENLPAALYTTDAAGRITFFNEAAVQLWGRRPRIGEDWWCGSWRLYWLDGSPMAHDECPMAITLKTGEPVRGAKAIAERPDGARYTFVPHPAPLFGPSGELRGAVNMLMDVTEYDRAEEATQRLAAIVASSEDAIISKTLNGIVTSWNEAAERMFGYAPDEIIGQSILKLIPADRHGEEVEIVGRIRKGERIEHYETVRRRKDGSLFDISLTVSPIKRQDETIIGASKIARDISERKRAEALLQQQAHRLETLNRVSRIISRDLDLDRIVQSVTNIATELSGARHGAFFYNDSGEAYLSASAARAAFESLGTETLFAPTFAGGQLVRSDDIRRDPRYHQSLPDPGKPKDHLPVVSYLAVPVISSSGQVLGGLFFGHEDPGRFAVETEGLVSAIAGQAAMAIDNARLHKAAQAEIDQRKRAEEAKALLLDEIKHRVKNSLATVQAIATQSFRHAPPDETRTFVARLHALSDAHNLLTEQSWDAVDIGSIVARALRPFMDVNRERIAVSGPAVPLDSSTALLLAMTLHEFSTNAVKYGALSNGTGRVEVAWSLAPAAVGRRLILQWRERGGPVVSPPTRKGFGSRMIERALNGQKGTVRFDYAPKGLSCLLEIAL